MPTDQDRELWTKAGQSPNELSEEEKLSALRLAKPATQATNTLKVTGLTLEELQTKALTDPKSMTLAECQLIKDGYRILNPAEKTANDPGTWPSEDFQAYLRVCLALRTPRDWDIVDAADEQANTIVTARGKAMMEQYAEDMEQPCPWVRRLIDPSDPITQSTRRWGFVVLREARTACSDESWAAFLQELEERIFTGVVFMKGGSIINQTRQFLFHDGLVDENDTESLHGTLPSGSDASPYILKNTYLLITPEVVASCAKDNSQEKWVWAYDANFDPKTTAVTGTGGEQYNGRLKVNLRTLFTWFYAVRSEELYSMDLLWEKARHEPSQAYHVLTTGGLYHHPLVLVEPGTGYFFNSYELEK
ncbi:uncharacterized protein PAC_15615 [Phialocephala subalpina]|uniref:Uncharacterized protein n=1 Tax=Phialocephala subalpina TaxID=576137 RepID=A0A1L7XKX5_9HELO|nr:uncharacterized protein PAC_15615 [Phialocephala subalpina]